LIERVASSVEREIEVHPAGKEQPEQLGTQFPAPAGWLSEIEMSDPEIEAPVAFTDLLISFRRVGNRIQ